MKKRLCFVCAIVVTLCLILSACARSTETLITDLGKADNKDIDKTVKELIAKGKEAAEPLREALKNTDRDTRLNACKALYAIEGEKAAGDIAPLLEDTDDGVATTAVQCLGKTGRAGVAAIAAYYSTKTPAGKHSLNSVEWMMQEPNVSGTLSEEYDSVRTTLDAMGPEAFDHMVAEYAGSSSETYKLTLTLMSNLLQEQKYDRALAMMEKGDGDFSAILGVLGHSKMTFERCLSHADDTQKQTVKKNLLMSYGTGSTKNGNAGMNSAQSFFSQKEMADIYKQEKDAGTKEKLLKGMLQISNSVFAESLLVSLSTSAAPEDISLMAGALAEKDDTYLKPFIDKYTHNADMQILKAMDKAKLWDKLLPMLKQGDGKSATLIGQLCYPEYLEKIFSYIRENKEIANNQINNLLRNYKDDRVLAFLKDFEFNNKKTLLGYLSSNISVDTYKDGFKYTKKGASGGPVKKIAIIERNLDHESGKAYDRVSGYTFTMMSPDYWISYAAPGADVAVYIKETHSYAGRYYFKSLHKTSKGYREGYKVVLVDLRTKCVLATKTLKGGKLPRTIYSSELEDNKYFATPPSDEKLEKAISDLLAMVD